MQLVDVIFLVISLVCGFLLYTKLGKNNSVTKNFNFSVRVNRGEATATGAPVTADLEAPLITGIEQIRQHDKRFSLNDFINWAKDRFETIVASFVKGDKEKLEALLHPDLYKAYVNELNDLHQKKWHGELDFFRMISARIKDIIIEKNMAKVNVHFVSEQTQVRKNEAGDIVEGDINYIDRISEIWTFERPLVSKTPWVLAGIKPYEAV